MGWLGSLSAVNSQLHQRNTLLTFYFHLNFPIAFLSQTPLPKHGSSATRAQEVSRQENLRQVERLPLRSRNLERLRCTQFSPLPAFFGVYLCAGADHNVQVFLNIVLDDAVEEKKNGDKVQIGMVVCAPLPLSPERVLQKPQALTFLSSI
jgi:hypothetical protein